MAEIRAKKLRPEDWSPSEDPAVINLGFDLTGRSTVAWNVHQSKNLLLAGYGVRQVEWALTSIAQHAKHHGLAVYGQDFSGYAATFPKGVFKGFTKDRTAAQQMLEELAASETEHLLIITALDHLLTPAYVPEAQREAEPKRREELVGALLRELANPAAHVVVVTSKLNEQASLPAELLSSFPTYVLTSKIFARDLKHLLRPAQDGELVSKIVHEMNAGNSVLLGDVVQEFQNFRPARK